MQFLNVTAGGTLCIVTSGLQIVNLNVVPLFISSVLNLLCVMDPSESLMKTKDPFSDKKKCI
jgi:hypothetical protein